MNFQIADFGMSRDLMDENYYVSHGGKIPVKWTAPEVTKASYSYICMLLETKLSFLVTLRLSITKSTPVLVMCGAMELSCTRYGVWDINHSRPLPIQRLVARAGLLFLYVYHA